jgi:hypothetical protein
MPMRRRAKVDANHAAIRDALRQIGWWVRDTSAFGEGWCDLFAAKAGRAVMVEIKNGKLKPSAQKLTPAQVKFHADAQRAGIEVRVITSIEEAVRL